MSPAPMAPKSASVSAWSPRVGVGMTRQPGGVGDGDSAQHDVVARAEAVDIETEPGARLAADQITGAGQIVIRGDLDVVFGPGDQAHGKTGLIGDGGVVGEGGAGEFSVGPGDVGVTEALWGLRPPQAVSGHGARDQAFLTTLQGVADGQRRNGAGRRLQGVQDP